MPSNGGLRPILSWCLSSKSSLASWLTLLAVSLGLYATLQDIADALLALAMALLVTTAAGRQRLRDPIVALLVIPVALSALWSADLTDTGRITARLLGLLIAVPLLSNQRARWFPCLLLAFALAAALSWSSARPNMLSDNAFSAAELGLAGVMSGSPWLAWIGALLVAASKTRSVLGLVWVYAALSGRWRILALAAMTTALWISSAAAAGQLQRFTPENLAAGVQERAQNTGLVQSDLPERVAREYHIEQPEQPPGVHWALGVGAGAYVEAYGRQRPHSVPLLLWAELGLLAIPAGLGLALLLMRAGMARAVALALLFTLWSDSAVGDAIGMYTVALLAAHSGRWWLSPNRSQPLYFLRLPVRLARRFRAGLLLRRLTL